jgi:hypothetical protein
MALRLCSLKPSLPALERRDEESVGPVAMRQSLKESWDGCHQLRLPRAEVAYAEVRVGAEEILHLALVLGHADRAGRVNEAPARPDGGRSRIEHPPLERSELVYLLGSLAPACIWA